jgi:ParB family chromosome partitioning protein
VAIGKIIEEREREKAKERMVDAHSSENFSQLGTGRTRDIVGAALGMSGPTYEAAKTVVTLAEADPETYEPVIAPSIRVQRIQKGSGHGKAPAG